MESEGGHLPIPISIWIMKAMLVADKNTVESPITLVDQYTGFDAATMTFDGTHPNSIGDSQMAERWIEKLVPVLETILTDPQFRTSRCQCTLATVAVASVRKGLLNRI